MSKKSKEFQLNQYITLKLENRETVIYVNDKKFLHCKYLLLNIPKEKLEEYEHIESIDEVAEKLDKSLECENMINIFLPPELEFWGHCSNLQVWMENDYNSCLLHRNLAFPLLKKLIELWDPLARIVFKEEIAKRFSSSFQNVITYLVNENFLYYLNSEEIHCLLEDKRDSLDGSYCQYILRDAARYWSIEGLNYFEPHQYNKAIKFQNNQLFMMFKERGIFAGIGFNQLRSYKSLNCGKEERKFTCKSRLREITFKFYNQDYSHPEF